jgi:hypothetical protein
MMLFPWVNLGYFIDIVTQFLTNLTSIIISIQEVYEN